LRRPYSLQQVKARIPHTNQDPAQPPVGHTFLKDGIQIQDFEVQGERTHVNPSSDLHETRKGKLIRERVY
jgi:hypothetical protein